MSKQFAVIGNPIEQSRSPELHHAFAEKTGISLNYTKRLAPLDGFEANINEFGKFDALKATVYQEKAKAFLEMLEGKPIKKFQINMKIDQMLRRFILEGGFDIS